MTDAPSDPGPFVPVYPELRRVLAPNAYDEMIRRVGRAMQAALDERRDIKPSAGLLPPRD